MSSNDETPLDRWTRRHKAHIALDLDLADVSGLDEDPALIVLRCGSLTMTLQPFRLGEQITLDVNGYTDGVKARLAPYGIEHNGQGDPNDYPADRGGQQQLTQAWGTSSGRPAAPFVCVVLGEQGGPAPHDVLDSPS